MGSQLSYPTLSRVSRTLGHRVVTQLCVPPFVSVAAINGTIEWHKDSQCQAHLLTSEPGEVLKETSALQTGIWNPSSCAWGRASENNAIYTSLIARSVLK